MKNVVTRTSVLLAGAALVLHTGLALAVSIPPDSKLPDAVNNTFRTKYPKAVIEKIDVLEENGINVYDIEFVDGPMEKEADIAEDGTMLEFTHVITLKQVPAAPLKTIRETAKAAKGAKYGRIERIEIDYETKDGKVVKLPATVLRYAAEMTRNGMSAEVIVNADGSVSEAPNWVKAQ
jgi:hypothetical protein